MELLITPAGVAEAAFLAPDFLAPEAIPESTILAAQQRFICPVLGGALCDAMAGGAYPEFLDGFVRPALALYVKMSMLPSLAVQTGAAGVVEVNPPGLARARDTRLNAAVRRLRDDARALMLRAVEHLEASPDDYPEYDPARNVLRRCSIAGGMVLARKTIAGRPEDEPFEVACGTTGTADHPVQ